MRVKNRIRNANPVPGAASGELSDRATRELAELVGAVGAVGAVPPAAARRPRRRGVLMAAAACGAAAVIGATVFTLQPDSTGPGSDPAGPVQGPGGGGAAADEPYFDSTAGLEGAANVIVRARLGAGREETADGESTTVAPAEVLATAKGKPSGKAIEVSYTTPGSGPETAGFAAGNEYVLLLEKSEDGDYLLVNTTQGWYGVEDGAAVSGKDNDVDLSPGVRKALRLTGQER